MADFEASPQTAVVSSPVQFLSVVTTNGGTITNRTWDFGDGSTGTGVSPTHVYTATGFYTVTLTITDTCGFTDTHISSVAVVPSTLFVDKKASPEPVEAGRATDLYGDVIQCKQC